MPWFIKQVLLTIITNIIVCDYYFVRIILSPIYNHYYKYYIIVSVFYECKINSNIVIYTIIIAVT